MLASLTDEQLLRMYTRAYMRMCKQLTGGISFGVDFPTLRIVAPGWHKTMRDIIDEMIRRDE